jgi:DNA-binding GntR family transcriptional regulator
MNGTEGGEPKVTANVDATGSAPLGQRQSLTDQVYAKLRAEILTARRRPESFLLENELAREFGVSKTPIREALRLLVHEGWVVVLPRKGYLVRPLRFEDVREIFAIRQMIEPSLVVEAIKRATAEQLDVLQAHVDAQAAAPDDATALDAAADFHIGIAKLAGNGRAERILTGLVDEARRMNHLSTNMSRRLREDDELTEHRDLVEAMRRQDIEHAQEVMERHTRSSLRHKLAGLTEI